MKTDPRIGAYTKALLEIALVEKRLDQVEEDLLAVSSAIKDNLSLKESIFGKKLPADKKKEIVQSIFASKISPLVVHFMEMLIDQESEEVMLGLAQEFSKKAYIARNIAQAEVITAVPIDQTTEDEIGKKLTQIFKKQIELKTRIDETIIGGLVIKVEGKVIDGSVRHQLEGLKKTLTNRE